MRPLLLAAAALVAPACIIEIGFQSDDRGDRPDRGDSVADADLFLSVAHAVPGSEIITTLESTTGRGLDGFEALQFERDVFVLDQVRRPDDVLLLLGVSPSAPAGPVQVVAVSQRAERRTLALPFVIDGLTTTGATPTGDTGSHGSTPTADTGSTGGSGTTAQ